MRLGSLFTGYGGLDTAACEHFDAETAWTSDVDPGACKVIAHRYPDVPNLGDITKIDWTAVEPVDILTGGSPCQDLSHAGKRAGMTEGTRSNLWVAMREAIAILRPRYVVWENVRGAYSAPADSDLESREGRVGTPGQHGPVLRALGRVLGDLSDLGFDARWCGIRAADVGAPHGRFRVFLLAWDANGTAGERGRSRAARGQSGTIESQAWAAVRREPVSADRNPPDSVAANSERGRRDGRTWQLGQGWRSQPQDGGNPATDTDSAGQPSVGRLDTQRRDTDRRSGANVAWGPYEPAIRRWERVLGRPAPAPTEASPRGTQRLSPRFVEHMMGLPEGWVTEVPGLSRNAQLKALGNGVVPQQCLAALRLMDTTEAAA